MKEFYSKELIIRLKELRLSNKLTQEDIGDIIGTNQSTYCNYECGRRNIPINTICTLADYYNVSINYLLGIKDPEEERVLN